MTLTGTEILQVRGVTGTGVPASGSFTTTTQDVADLANGDPTNLTGIETLEILGQDPASIPASATFSVTTQAIAALASGSTFLTGNETLEVTSVSDLGRVAAIPFTTTTQEIANLAGSQPISPDINDNVTGLDYFWDAKGGYDGSAQIWSNQITTPSDGSAQTDSDVYLGTSSTPGSANPTFVQNHWLFNGNRLFTHVHSNPPQIANMHKGTQSWTWFAKIQSGDTLATINAMFGTADVAGNFGVVIRGDSGGNFKVDQYDGVTIHTKAISAAIIPATVYDVAVAYDHATDTIKLAVNNTTWTPFKPSGWNLAATSPATFNFDIAARGNANSKMANTTKLFGMFICDHAMTDAELEKAVLWADSYYFPILPTVPTPPTRLVLNPGDGNVSIAWVVAAASPIVTNCVAQYKLHADVSWTTFSHSATGYPGITVTGLTNGQLYDFRVAAVNTAGASDYSSTSSATPAADVSDPYSLVPYKITLPVDSNGNRSGISAEINQPALLTYESAWFSKVGDTFVYKCPDGGATTSSNADFARSELRDLTDHPLSGTGDDTVTFAVTQIPDSLKTVTHQIHGGGSDADPWVKMVYSGKNNGTGLYRALIQPSSDPASLCTLTLKNHITNGDHTTCRIQIVQEAGGAFMQIYIDGSVTPSTVLAQSNANGPGVGNPCRVQMFRSDIWYFKRGNYFQTKAGNGDICTVIHYPNP